MTDADMEGLGFNQEEKDKLSQIILSQQSNWVAQERLNQLYPLRPLGPPPPGAGAADASSSAPAAPESAQHRPHLVTCDECFAYTKPEELEAHKQAHERRRQQVPSERLRGGGGGGSKAQRRWTGESAGGGGPGERGTNRSADESGIVQV